MKFDFTQEILLEKKHYKIYRFFQGFLYLAAFVFGLYLIFSLLFPTGYFTFSFVNFNSTKNTLADPRNENGETLERGKIKADETMVADASIAGNYSKAIISFTLSKKSGKMDNGKVEVKKSYRAFLFPEGDGIGFQDGSLLKNGDNFYIISEGKSRKFSAKGGNENLAMIMGFNKDAFIEISNDDLAYNPAGDIISEKENYPENTLFKIKDDFYRLSGEKLEKFISANAFLSRFNENQAVIKDENFLQKFEVSENLLGFAEGSLIAYGESAFIVNGEEILPIGDPSIFEASGFFWNDITNVSGDEISMYLKGKIFALDSVHPNGTVFFSKDSGKFYIIMDGMKHLLSGEKAAVSWNKRAPILVSEKSLNVLDSCHFQKKSFNLRNTSCICEIPIENMANLLGKDYEFRLSFENEIEIDRMDVSFKKTVSKADLWQSVFNLLGKIKGNYVKQ